MKRRRLVCAKTSSNLRRTARSLGVYPLRSTLVESCKQRENTALAVFGEGVQIEELVVGGRGIDFEIAGMDDHAERGVDRQSNAIDQTMRDLDGMNGEWSDFEALVGAHLAQSRRRRAGRARRALSST